MDILKKLFSISIDEDVRHVSVKLFGLKMNFKRKMPPKEYAGKKVLSDKDGNNLISEMLQTDKPFMIMRFGYTELKTFNYYLESKEKDNLIFSGDNKKYIRDLSGFFSNNNECLRKYCKILAEDIVPNADVIATLVYHNEELNAVKLADEHCKIMHWVPLSASLFFLKNPWVQYLAGKRVLVIHPFEETIKSQHAKLDKLFSNKLMAPKYELLTLKTVQSLGIEDDETFPFKDWFEALDYMYKEIDKKDFDVALIAGGAYGPFLADYVKRKGKQSILMCGTLQLLFGIKGTRWDEAGIYNEHWVRPSADEKPKNLGNYLAGEPNAAYW